VAFKEKLVLNRDDLQERKNALESMEKELDDVGAQLVMRAASLSKERKRSARALEEAVEDELKQLHMRDTHFRLHFDGPDAEKKVLTSPDIRDIRHPAQRKFHLCSQGLDALCVFHC